MKDKKTRYIWVSLGAIAVFTVLLGLSLGPAKITFWNLFLEQNIDIFYLRLFRVVLAVLAGAGLGVCGVVLQGILRNPLAEPYILGISSGAGLGAVIAIILGLAATVMPLVAFLGAIISLALVYRLANIEGKLNVHAMILSGVIINIMFSGIMIFLIFISPNEALYGVMGWLLGHLQIFTPVTLVYLAVVVCMGISIIWIFSRDLNAISIGEEEAMHLGIDTELIKKVLFITTSLITASIVCICGLIGFVGLVIPHIMRLIIGPDHRRLIPTTALASACFLLISDTIARCILTSVEIPIGIITAIVGAPIFIFLLRRRQRIYVR
jgi:iron complex transport system permease protein